MDRRCFLGRIAGLLGIATMTPEVLQSEPDPFTLSDKARVEYESTEYGSNWYHDYWIENWPNKNDVGPITWEPQRKYEVGDKLTSKGWGGGTYDVEETWELQSDNVFRVIKAERKAIKELIK